MTKVYYGKDAIKPDFLRSSDSSSHHDSNLFRNQLAQESLKTAEESSLSNFTSSEDTSAQAIETRPLYTGSSHKTKTQSKIQKTKSATHKFKHLKKYAPLYIIAIFFFGIIFFIFTSVGNLGNQIESLITRATDTMFGSYSENTLRITEELLEKKQGTFPKYFENRLKTNGIEVADKGDSYNFLYNGTTITPQNFRNFYMKNIPFQEAFTKAKRARTSNFFDKPAVMTLSKIGITRNLYSRYRQTGNHDTDTKNYKTTEEKVFGDKTNTSINTTTETEVSDDQGNKTTEVTKSGEDIDSNRVDGDTPEIKANNYLLSTAGRVAETGGLVCGALKVANLISIAVAANQLYQAKHFFMSNIENVSKTKAGYGGESAINSFLNFLTESVTTEHTDVSTGQRQTITGAPIEAEGFSNVLAGEPVNLNTTKNYSIDSVFLASGVALGLTATRAKICGGIKAVGAVISLTTLAFGGGLIKAVATLAKTTVINAGIATAIAGMLTVLIPYIQKTLFENPVQNFVGKPGGENFVKGGDLVNKKIGRSSSGQSLASREYAEKYHKETLSAATREAKLDRATKSPFDLNSPNTFLGSLLGRFSKISTTNSFLSSFSQLSSITTSSLKGLINHTSGVFATDGSESFVADNELTGIRFQKIYSDEKTCEYLTEIDAACNMYGSEIIATDTSTEKISSSDPEYQRIIKQNIRKNAQGFDEVIPNSLLAHKTMFCDDRDSPFGHYDANIANAFNTSLGFANNIPYISDAVELTNAISEMSPETSGWATGAFCVMSQKNPHWSEMSYLQHYTEHNRICTQIKCASNTDAEGNEYNPITAYKEAYYQKNPIDTSRSGIIARISGITKNQAETIIAFLDYANYLANYTPPAETAKDSESNLLKTFSLGSRSQAVTRFSLEYLTNLPANHIIAKSLLRNRNYLI